MSAGVSVTADELIRALAHRAASLPSEIGTFIALEACDAMLTSGPREIPSLAHLRISAQGDVALSGPACEERASVHSLHRALTLLLEAAGPLLPPGLARLAEPAMGEACGSLPALRDELEAALVPLNRTASRRVLARFARDAAIYLQALQPAHDGAGSAPAGSAQRSSPEPAESPDEVEPAESAPRFVRPRAGYEPLGRSEREPSGGHDLHEPGAGAERRPPSLRPSFAPRPPSRERDSFASLRVREPGASGSSAEAVRGARKLFVGFALAAVALAALALMLALRATERARERDRGSESLAAPSAERAPDSGAELVVRVKQPNAQLLRFVGRAPVTVSQVALGTAHEFVATAEGHQPARVLVAENADWEATAEGARYELALQLAAAPSDSADALELGPSRIAHIRSQAGSTGTIRVVTTPPGARVYQLIGFSPEVRLSVPRGESAELLVYREGYRPLLRVVPPSAFVERAGMRTAELELELSRR